MHLDRDTQITHAASRRLRVLLLAVLVLAAGAAHAVTVSELASGLSAAVGVDYDGDNNHLYFVEWAAGTLKRMALDPTCEPAGPPACPITTVATGFSHPQDVAVNAAGGVAYVTTRDDPGTTGALWRVDLGTGTKTLITFNLGAPHQIALDPATDSAYAVGFDNGRLWRIELTTGVKVTLASGLDHPIGLAVTADRTRAYVTESGAANQLVEIDLATGATLRQVVTGLTSPFYLRWSDAAEVALFLVERDPANRLLRVDVLTGISAEVAAGLPFRPSGAAVNAFAGAVYVTTDSSLMRVTVSDLPTEPGFLGVGHVPVSNIDDGYADTSVDPGYFYQVKHSPFGGTLNIFGNLNNFKALGATHYRVLVSNGGPATPVTVSWNAYRWNPATFKYQLTPVAPVPGQDRYEIPVEYPSAPQRWYPSFLMLRWPSSANGLHTFTLELEDNAGNPVPLVAGNSLTLRIDNTPPTVDLKEIRQLTSPVNVVEPCEIVSAGVNSYNFKVTAYDPNQHLLSYELWAEWGKNCSQRNVISDSYASHVDPTPPDRWWGGVSNAIEPAGGWAAKCNCAHTFHLRAWKRTINGYNYILRRDSHQSVTLNNTGAVWPACPCS